MSELDTAVDIQKEAITNIRTRSPLLRFWSLPRGANFFLENDGLMFWGYTKTGFCTMKYAGVETSTSCLIFPWTKVRRTNF